MLNPTYRASEVVLSGKLKPSVVKFEPSEAQIKHQAALVFITTVSEKLLLQGQRFPVVAIIQTSMLSVTQERRPTQGSICFYF